MSKVHKSAQRLEATLKRIDNLDSESDKKLILKVKDEAFAFSLHPNNPFLLGQQ